MDNLKKLEEILKKCIENGWKYKSLHTRDIQCLETCLQVFYSTDIGGYDDNFSYDDLFSLDYGLLQFVRWSSPEGNICINAMDNFSEDSTGFRYDTKYEDYERQYHAMRMSILSVEEKIERFINNSIVDENNR